MNPVGTGLASHQTQGRGSTAAWLHLPARFARKRSRASVSKGLKLHTVLNGSRSGLIIVTLLQVITSGCYCSRLHFPAFEGPDVRVVDRTLKIREYGVWTIWPIPARYEVVRQKYTIEILTVLPHGNPPSVIVRARTPEGGHLQIFADGQLRKHQWMPGIRVEPKRGSISFDVLLEGEKIGSESFDYEIQSRPFACEYDLP